mgnify:CR=1 FL=1
MQQVYVYYRGQDADGSQTVLVGYQRSPCCIEQVPQVLIYREEHTKGIV